MQHREIKAILLAMDVKYVWGQDPGDVSRQCVFLFVQGWRQFGRTTEFLVDGAGGIVEPSRWLQVVVSAPEKDRERLLRVCDLSMLPNDRQLRSVRKRIEIARLWRETPSPIFGEESRARLADEAIEEAVAFLVMADAP
jgi:hypothetical protein